MYSCSLMCPAVLREAGVELDLSKLQLAEGGGAPLELLSQVRCSGRGSSCRDIELSPSLLVHSQCDG